MSQKNLYNQEAREKIKELAESIDFAMMCTDLENMPFHSIPMSTKEIDAEGDIWFLSSTESHHTEHILKDNRSVLLYSKPGNMSFLKIHGFAHVVRDKTRIESLYGKMDDTWFDGVDDPKLCSIKFQPREAQYWEPKHNKIITLFKMGVGALTNSEPNLGNTGSLKV